MKKFLFSFFFLASFSLFPFTLVAQTPSAGLTPEQRAALQSELLVLEGEISAQQKILDGKKKESASLERDVAILDAQIKQAQLSIQAQNLTIQNLTSDINTKQKTIGVLSGKLDREKESLSQILRKTYEIDDNSLPEVILRGSGTISDFFSDLDSFHSVKQSLQASLGVVAETRDETQDQKEVLEEKKSEQTELLHIQQLEKAKIQEQEKQKQQILKASKGQEAEYQKVLAQKQQSATEIRRALFQLQGSAAIPFGTAYNYAKEVEGRLGVRAAFLLGIVAEESNLGENLGTGNWRKDMHPTRDQPVFEKITSELGLNPDLMPVSKKAWYGWGGAMGPAQFIPSTWILYKDKIAAATGHNPPNPWDPYDAFFASGILLKDNGADKGTRAAERLSALRYLAGWQNASKPAYAFYGNEVMDLADKYQAQIDIILR